MKSICFVTTGDIKTNATAKRALGMANPLADLGWRVHILMEDTPENHHRASIECDGRTTVHYFPHLPANKERAEKAKLLKAIHPDCLYLSAFVFRNIVPYKGRCTRIVEHSELMASVCNRNLAHKVLDAFLEYSSILYADGLVNASVYLHDTYQRRASLLPRRLRPAMLHLPYAYSPSMVRPQPASTGCPGKYKGKTLFVYLGTITANYGIFTLLEAARLLSQERRDFCLAVLGQGNDFGAATRLAGKLGGCVDMCGFVSEERIPHYFSQAAAFILPLNDTVQDWARCPSKLFMYLPYGKPVITCRIGEALHVLGEQGLYYQPGNAAELKERMACVADGKAGGLGINPQEHSWPARAKVFDGWAMAALKKKSHKNLT